MVNLVVGSKFVDGFSRIWWSHWLHYDSMVSLYLIAASIFLVFLVDCVFIFSFSLKYFDFALPPVVDACFCSSFTIFTVTECAAVYKNPFFPLFGFQSRMFPLYFCTFHQMLPLLEVQIYLLCDWALSIIGLACAQTGVIATCESFAAFHWFVSFIFWDARSVTRRSLWRNY